ncbi:alginate export family protein [Aquimarina agarivorans]|uniref:alginate export family protein n=1 Tax=Aquimarina agarivorans TaxID=980584 RepID=UPI000248E9CA|nr:alginate export family protein [Aquimarina agarivorans]
MKKSHLLISALLGLGLYSASAQELSIDAMIRPRFEYRHGFQDVAPDGVEPAAFVSQRSSLLVKYSDSKITAFLDFQDVSVWGDRPQLSANDDPTNQTGFLVNQAWAEIKLGNKGWSTKLGRQLLSYDDQRILGGLGWAQQQRTHDVALFRYKKSSLKLDVGFAFNQERDGGNNFNTIFNGRGLGGQIFQYKAMQFAHLSGKLSENFKGSFLFMNNTFQDRETIPAVEATPGNLTSFPIVLPTPASPARSVTTDGTSSRQTTGFYGAYNVPNFTLTGSVYYQFGKFNKNVDISAYQASLFAGYKPSSGAFKLIGLGAEILSGDKDGVGGGETTAFFPLFGTNHKFNGFQDFFYVGRHANDVGLIDIHLKSVIKTGAKSKLIGFVHNFSAADARDGMDSNLGTSVDLVYVQGITPYANIKVGYSQSFLGDDFANARASRGNDIPLEADSNQSWGWVMITVNPNIFKWKKEAAPEAK